MGKPFFVLRTPLRRSRERSRRATKSGPVKSTAGRAMASRIRSGMLVGPGCMKNGQPRDTVIGDTPRIDPEDDTGLAGPEKQTAAQGRPPSDCVPKSARDARDRLPDAVDALVLVARNARHRPL